jgi:hypothetical protein
VKAHSPRTEASRPKKAKAAVRAVNGARRAPLKTDPARAIKPSPGKTKPTLAKLAAPVKTAPLKIAIKATSPNKPSAPASAKPSAPKGLSAATKASAPVKASAPLKAAAPAKATASVKAVAPVKSGIVAKPNAAKPAAAAAPLPAPKKPARKSIKEAAGVSTDAVARRTGKTWDDWFEVLDTAGAATLDQRGVIAILAQKHGIGPWWQQMIAVGYESLRGASDKPPAADGFQISSSCSLDAPLNRVFRLWNDPGERARWLADDRFVVRATTADKVIRARWGKGTSHVAVSFAEKSGRTEVSVEHHQIESRGAADQMKAYWAKKLGLLDQALTPRR